MRCARKRAGRGEGVRNEGDRFFGGDGRGGARGGGEGGAARSGSGAADEAASSSAALNASEGVWAKAGKRRSRLEDAANSARETLVALRVAGACGYLGPDEVAAGVKRLETIIPVLWVAYRR